MTTLETEPLSPILRWLPAGGITSIRIERRGGLWYATALEFGLAGMGDSEQAARANVSAALRTYFQNRQSRDIAFEEALRPLPRRSQAWVTVASPLGRLFGGRLFPKREDVELAAIVQPMSST